MTLSFRQRALAGEPLVGAFLNAGSPVSAEVCGRAGFDFLIVDLEHGLGSEATLLPHLHAVGPTAATAVVRVEANARSRIARVLDQGAAGVMVPSIDGVADAERAVSYLRYPPAGVRGVALSTRSSGFGSLRHELVATRNDAVVGILQIETPAAVEAVDAIAAIDGADVLFVGPSDLTHSMGIPGAFEHPRYVTALDAVAHAARAHGKACGVLCSLAEVDRFLERGYSVLAVGSDSGLLAAQAASAVRGFRQAAERR